MPMMRRYETDEDYWQVRPFLREVFLLNGRREVSWHVARGTTGAGPALKAGEMDRWRIRCSSGSCPTVRSPPY
jgi:hypothetical protein